MTTLSLIRVHHGRRFTVQLDCSFPARTLTWGAWLYQGKEQAQTKKSEVVLAPRFVGALARKLKKRIKQKLGRQQTSMRATEIDSSVFQVLDKVALQPYVYLNMVHKFVQ